MSDRSDVVENVKWLWFVRGTMMIAWPILVWAAHTLLSVSQSQELTTQLLMINVRRIDKLEDWKEKSDKDKLDWLRSRSRGGMVP